MSSSSADRSITSGISLPQWMKSKVSDRYDWEQSAVSPYTESDSFFIPYPLSSSDSKTEAKLDTEPTYLSEVVPETRMKRSPTMPEEQMKSNAAAISNLEDTSSRSMVSVAQNMFSGKLFGSYLSADYNKPDLQAPHIRQRRNSKSLPASPLSSPKIHRKNPYFADPFAKPNETFEPRAGLILSIMSQRKSIEDLAGGSNADSSASETNSPKISRHPKIMEHPGELREMNFWSPVSM